MLDPLILDDTQRANLDILLSNTSGAYLDGSDVGVGKTLLTVEYIKASGVQTVLIIAPVPTLGIPLEEGASDAEGWWGTIMRQRVELPFRIIDSSAKGKKAAADWQWKVPGIYFVSHQMFIRMGWQKVRKADGTIKQKWVARTKKWVDEEERTNVWQTNPDLIVFDEVHQAQNAQSRTSKTLRGGRLGFKAVKAKMKAGLSGTWTGNGFDGAWAVTKWLWPDLIDDSIYVWRARYAIVKYDPFAELNQKNDGERGPGEFANTLPCYIRVESNFNIQVQEKKFWVNLLPEQRRIYDELVDQAVAWIKDRPFVIKFPVTKRIRLRQTTLAVPKITHVINKKTGEKDIEVDFEVDAESSEIDILLLEVLPEGKFFDGESALIYTDSQKFARILTQRINMHYHGEVAREWSGKIPKKVRLQNKADYLEGKFKYIVGVISAMGTGTDLLQKATRNIATMSLDDDGLKNTQGYGRTNRRGQPSPFVRLAHIMAHDTYDDEQWENLIDQETKRNMSMRKRRK